MKTKTLILLALWSLCLTTQAAVEHLLPRPHQISTNTAGTFSLAQNIRLILPAINANDPAVNTELTNLIAGNGGSVSESATTTIEVQIVSAIANAEFQEEAYSINVAPSKIIISATTLKGAFWATQTLCQLAENAGGNIVGCDITDWPAFRVRGYMHDIGRSYIQFAELKNEILRLSRYKINVFHWHLTDNQGWRLESKIYPQLNANASYTRQPGLFYTIDQAKELVTFARQHGVTVIPEIDMPGHSLAFRTAMGHSMLTDAGLTEMKNIMTEACATFSDTEWMHIGTDEVRTDDQGTMAWTTFVPQMVAHIRAQGKKVVSWNPGYSYTADAIDMTQMWSSSGTILPGVPAIDSRYHYINHFDSYADIASLYNSTIAQQQKGSNQYAGVIVATWNDRLLPSDADIVKQNSFYPAMLAIAERSWLGGGKGYFTSIGVKLDPTDVQYSDFERRFLFHKANFLQNEPIAYVQQTNVHWRITDAFPNSGVLSTTFPPETALANSYTYNGTTYNTKQATGAGIYLRHTWGTLIPAFFSTPQANATAYAYTYVYSPKAQTVGAQIEFQNYGRSEADVAPPQGQWDYNQSKIWINDIAIAPPTWLNTSTTRNNEITLKNENFSARTPVAVQLNQGWNKVLIKLPNAGFSLSGIRLVKWMFTCVFVTPDGKDAVSGLVYSPDQNLNPNLDILISAIDKANAQKNSALPGSEPGKYSVDAIEAFNAEIATAVFARNNETLTDEQYRQAAETLITQTQQFKEAINYPKVSAGTKEYWYSLSTPLRNNGTYNFVAYQGNNVAVKGETYVANTAKQLWKVVQNIDGTYNLVSKAANSYIDPNSAYNTALKAQAGMPASGGWSFTPIYANNYFAIVNAGVQFNQTGSGLSYQIYNWGGGSNTTDTGCQFLFRTEAIVGADALDSLQMAVDDALSYKLSVSVGTAPGQYSEANTDAFNTAIIAAKTVKNNVGSTLAELRQAKLTLLAAQQSYKESINTPILSDSGKNVWYSLTSQRDNKAVAYQSDNSSLKGESYVSGADKFLWKFVQLTDGTSSLINKESNNYIISATTGTPPLLISSTGTQTLGGWKFTPVYDGLYFIVTSNTAQFNQGNSGSGYPIYNWGGGTNTTDIGCRYIIAEVSRNITGIDNSTTSKIHIWSENRMIHISGTDAQPELYSIDGRKLDVLKRIESDMVIVKVDGVVQKVVVR